MHSVSSHCPCRLSVGHPASQQRVATGSPGRRLEGRRLNRSGYLLLRISLFLESLWAGCQPSTKVHSSLWVVPSPTPPPTFSIQISQLPSQAREWKLGFLLAPMCCTLFHPTLLTPIHCLIFLLSINCQASRKKLQYLHVSLLVLKPLEPVGVTVTVLTPHTAFLYPADPL